MSDQRAAFLAGEGTLTVEQVRQWANEVDPARALPRSPNGLRPDEPLMVSLVSPVPHRGEDDDCDECGEHGPIVFQYDTEFGLCGSCAVKRLEEFVERDAARPYRGEMVERGAELLRNMEWAASITPRRTVADDQSEEWARTRVATLLNELLGPATDQEREKP